MKVQRMLENLWFQRSRSRYSATGSIENKDSGLDANYVLYVLSLSLSIALSLYVYITQREALYS